MVSPVWFIVGPLFSAFLVYTLSVVKNNLIPKTVSFLAIGFNVALSFSMLTSLTGAVSVTIAGFAPPLGINLYADKFAVYFLVAVNTVSFLSLLYSYSYIEKDTGFYHILFLLLVAGANGMVLTGDIFNLFVFFEILCISSYALVAFDKNKNSLEAAIKYLILGSVGSIFILIAIALIYLTTGTLNIADIAVKFSSVSDSYKLLISVFLVAGLGVEAAVFPLNTWLPDAHSSAPSSISAVLSGFVIEIPLFIIVKLVLTVFGADEFKNVFMIAAVLTLLVGEIAAFRQTNVKRMLAYSSMGQVGLMLLALAAGTHAAVNGALLQFVNHAAAKGLLFFAAGIFIKRTGSYDIADYKGIAQKMPYISAAFAVGVLSLIGVPPFFGFFSKFKIITAVMNTGGMIPVLFALLGTIIETVYFIRIIQIIYSKKEATIAGENAVTAAIIPLALAAFLIAAVTVLPRVESVTNGAVEAYLKAPVLIRGN